MFKNFLVQFLFFFIATIFFVACKEGSTNPLGNNATIRTNSGIINTNSGGSGSGSGSSGVRGWGSFVFGGRIDHSSVVFKDKIWNISGNEKRYYSQKEVSSSSNGKDWVKKATTWGRSDHTSVVFRDKLWVLGGIESLNGGGSDTLTNDVWSSVDGKTWKQEVAAAGWSARRNHTSVVFKDRIWVLGGIIGMKITSADYLPFPVYVSINDVWSSVDGKTWKQEVAAAAWTNRADHTSVVFRDKLWVLGGIESLNGGGSDTLTNDVWSSVDGRDWVLETSVAAWSGRMEHTSVVYRDKLWVIAGKFQKDISILNYRYTYYKDVWMSADGKDWVKLAATPWGERSVHTSVVFKDRLWVIGGEYPYHKNRDIFIKRNKTWFYNH